MLYHVWSFLELGQENRNNLELRTTINSLKVEARKLRSYITSVHRIGSNTIELFNTMSTSIEKLLNISATKESAKESAKGRKVAFFFIF